MKKVTRITLLVCGTIAVALGVVGMILPVLPTTPFLLLAAVCYAHSSPRFYHWLLNNRWFGEYIRNYREGNGMPLRQKIITIGLLWLTIGLSAVYAVSLWWVRLILLCIAAGVTTHLVRIKTSPPTGAKSAVRVEKKLPEDAL